MSVIAKRTLTINISEKDQLKSSIS